MHRKVLQRLFSRSCGPLDSAMLFPLGSRPMKRLRSVVPTSRVGSSFSSSSSPSSFCDVLILGGGMVGGSLACLLADHPAFRDKKTIVLERGGKTESREDAPFSNRVCELSPATVKFLDGIGVWPLMKGRRSVRF